MAPDKKIKTQEIRLKRIQAKIEADKADEFAKRVATAKKARHLSAKALDLYTKALGEKQSQTLIPAGKVPERKMAPATIWWKSR